MAGAWWRWSKLVPEAAGEDTAGGTARIHSAANEALQLLAAASERVLLRPLADGASGKGSPFSSELGRRGGAMVANGVLAIGTHDGMLQLIDAETGALRMDVQAHQQSVQCVALSPAGDLLATASFDRSWKLWDVSTGAELRCVP
ncbi:hypothetical protein T484DRAFT_1775864 [Baffinella frigidus]|nr:hypothetical protein T484DRAFT_1775864 [Cryptophyta sp. CCMP2293]